MATTIPVESPRVLTLPGLEGSCADHWQSVWERERRDCRRVELGNWSNPDRDTWSARLDYAIAIDAGPIYLVAHSLGCLAVCWWATRAAAPNLAKVAGALLVAPPDVDRDGVDPRLVRFSPTPPQPLPFAAMLVASSNDPYAGIDRSRRMAALWAADFVDLGPIGHINAHSALGRWQAGQDLLATLMDPNGQQPGRATIPDRVDHNGRRAVVAGHWTKGGEKPHAARQ